MNLPNKLSLLRVILIPVMVALLYPRTDACNIAAAAVFALASFTDFLDGHIARKRGLVTDFGKFVDPVADKLLVLSAMVMLIQHGLMLAWVTVVILARELCVDGLRLVAISEGRVIAAGPLGKIKTASQMLMILMLLLLRRPLFSFPVGLAAGIWVCFITLWSGIDYFRQNFSLFR